MKYYILFGPPGAGKGTQAASMVERYNLHHISTGALLRKEIAAGTELGKLAASLIDKGNLVPDEVVIEIIANEFKKTTEVDGFILDGFPRTLPQAEALDAMLEKVSGQVTGTISIMIPDSLVMERIKGRALKEGRADDASEDIINTRIATYHRQTEPLINYYSQQGKYHEINGVGTVGQVCERIFSVMDKI